MRLRFAVVAVSVFAFLLFALMRQQAPAPEGFDQPFYHAIAYDLDRYGTFTNGVFGPVGSDASPPPAGMFFMPLYPALVWTVMQVSAPFAETIKCAHNKRTDPNHTPCTPQTRAMLMVHALLLTIGVLAIGLAAHILIAHPWAFPLASLIAALGAYSHAGLFIYLMTESLSFCLYSLTTLALLVTLKRQTAASFAVTGVLVGILVLTRPAFLLLCPIFIAIFLAQRWPLRRAKIPAVHIALFAACFCVTLLPWQVRNYVSVGKFGLTEEYGAQQIVERFGFNKMTLREGLIAFPAALPQVGVALVRSMFGTEDMRRFAWDEPDGFYQSGMARRNELVRTYGRVDPIIGQIVSDELRENWWRHILTTFPIAWCGLWVGQTWGLLLIPLFFGVLFTSVRERRMLYLAYTVPALVMILAHGALANHNVRYNIGFIGPIAVAADYLVLRVLGALQRRRGGTPRAVVLT